MFQKISSEVSVLLLLLLVAMATAMPQCEPAMPFQPTAHQRMAARKMLEECVGKEQFEKCAMKMASVLEGCMKKQPEEYLMNKIDMSELPVTGDAKMDAMWAKMPYRVGNFSCFLSTMEVMTDKGINIPKMKEMIDESFSDKKMREDLHEHVVDCEKFAQAMPSGLISRGKPPMFEKIVPEHVVRMGAYFHCFRGGIAHLYHHKKHPTLFTPFMFLKISRIPNLDNLRSVFEDVFLPMSEDHPVSP